MSSENNTNANDEQHCALNLHWHDASVPSTLYYKPTAQESFKLFCMSIFCNPSMINRITRYLTNQKYVCGFRNHMRQGKPFPVNRELTRNDTNDLFSSVRATHLSIETVDDAMRLMTRNILTSQFKQGDDEQDGLARRTSNLDIRDVAAPIRNMSLDYTLQFLINRVLILFETKEQKLNKGGSEFWRQQSILSFLRKSNTMVLPEILILLIEYLLPRLNFRVTHFHTEGNPIVLDPSSNITGNRHTAANSWFMLWSHSYLALPHLLFTGDPLVPMSLLYLAPHMNDIFYRPGSRPCLSMGMGINTPVYYEGCKYDKDILVHYYDGWYFTLSYILHIVMMIVASCPVKIYLKRRGGGGGGDNGNGSVDYENSNVMQTDGRTGNQNDKQRYNVYLAYKRWFTDIICSLDFITTGNLHALLKNHVNLDYVKTGKALIRQQQNQPRTIFEGGDDYNLSGDMARRRDQKTKEIDNSNGDGDDDSKSSCLTPHDFMEWLHDQPWVQFKSSDICDDDNPDKEESSTANRDSSLNSLSHQDHALFLSWTGGGTYLFWNQIVLRKIQNIYDRYTALKILPKWGS